MKKKTKKEIFFEESLKLIHKKGFKGTTLRDIAQKLNFEVANVYNYIDSKDSLLDTYISDITKEFHDGIDNVVNSSYSPEVKLRLVVSKHVQLAVNRPYELALLENDWRHLKEPALSKFIEERTAYMNKLVHIIKDGVEIGQFRAIDIEIIAFTILSSIRWLYRKIVDDESKINPVELEKEVVDFIFMGIRKV
ncbi:TetR/AcrR family transcriptional regulator [Maribacter algarum]|uniref:TetR/AcrR family transcriptional regulator n=1 Tax=Maribacter algarum (ex Zhang et al. 2020) TaxID=2578118 RepID=A0A5S3PPI3_9FLAO|nr:TetR family transcriptional regulator [Maribacter algarum]TMM56650.1 TetR/AcrR family transcriptional regulator [Maribacter algarum]